ncbi:hypothetical protein KJ758_02430, partial [Patescibacteria group bacterium]|nr:hypothetical protein [Patescibacteria group bacterium]
MAQKIRRLLFRADRMWLVAVITMFALVTLGYASLLNTQPALAVAPVGASAVIQNSTATTVDVVITGTDFASFVNSGTTTAGASDLTGITYNSVNPSSATTNGTNTITATFPISMGTAVIGNLTIDAGIVQDGVGSGNQNLLITIASGSITDSAKPVP